MKIPFPFILDELASLNPQLRSMFGCVAIYVGEKIVLIQRHKEDHLEDNGVWLGSIPENHAELAKIFPSMRSIVMFGPGPTAWQNLPLDSDDFEASVMKACELIRRGSPLIGKVPAKKKKSLQKKEPRSRVRKRGSSTRKPKRSASKTRKT